MIPTLMNYIKEFQNNPIQTQGEIFVFIDECHRSQSGKLNQVMKAVLHNAVFIALLEPRY